MRMANVIILNNFVNGIIHLNMAFREYTEWLLTFFLTHNLFVSKIVPIV